MTNWYYIKYNKDMERNKRKYYLYIIKRFSISHSEMTFSEFSDRVRYCKAGAERGEVRVVAWHRSGADWWYQGSYVWHSNRQYDEEVFVHLENKIGGKVL